MSTLHSDLVGENLHEAFHYVQPGDPGAVGADKYWLDITSSPYVLKRRNSADTAWVVVGADPAGNVAIYPQNAIRYGNEFRVTAGTVSIALTVSTAQLFGLLMNTSGTPAQNDAISTTVMLEAGTYDIEIRGRSGTNRAIVNWSCNGSDFITNQDWYSGSSVENVSKTGALTVGSSGRQLITCTAVNKNASSSSYAISVTYISFIKQSLSSGV